MTTRLLANKCRCGKSFAFPTEAIDGDMPVQCPFCLTSWWMTRPESGGGVWAMEVSDRAQDSLAFLTAESTDVRRFVRGVIKRRRAPKPDWN